MPHHEKEHQCCYHQRQRGGQSKQIEIASLLDRLAEEKDRKDCDHDADEVTLEILETVDLKPARQRHSFVHKQPVQTEPNHERDERSAAPCSPDPRLRA